MRKLSHESASFSHRYLLLIVLLFAAFFGAASAPVFAQSTFGTIVGTVSDSADAVVPGASVVVTNEATGTARTATSDSSGEYRLVNLDPGTYTITVTVENFSTVKDEHVVLPSRETVRSDIRLSPKSISQEVVVDAKQEAISEDLAQSNSLSGIEISSLPLNFRATGNPSPIGVAALTPTVNSDSTGNLTFAGQLPTATSFSLDGLSIQSVRYGGPSRDMFPSIEGIDEFRVNTAGGSAEYAQPTDLTVVTRSGTNKFHGSAYWFAQRKGWDSTDLIAQQALGANANTYGGAVGGPIWKNHTFFWFDYEGVRLSQNTLIQTQTFPTAWTGGDFSAVPGLTLINPLSGTPFPSNNLGAFLPINATSSKILPLFFPSPAGPNAASSNIDATGNNFVTVLPGKYSVNGYDGRIDHAFNERHRVYGRVTDKQITSSGTDGGSGDTTYDPLLGTFTTTTGLLNVVFSHNWVISPSLVNEARGGWTTVNFKYGYPQAAQGNAIINELGIAGTPGPPANGLGGVPVFYIGNFFGGETNNFGHPRVSKNRTIEVGDGLSWTRGRFNSKFGGEFIRRSYQDNITFNLGDEYGDYTVTGDYDKIEGGVPCTPAELSTYANACAAAQFYLGLIDFALQAQNGPDGKPYNHHFGFYGQTEFKANQNLTINVGLRYELNTPFIDSTNQLGNFNYNVPGGQLIVNPNEKINPIWAQAVGNTPFVLNNAPGVGLPSGLRFLDKTNIQPRFGFAFKPSGTSNSIIKGSVGSYSVPVLGAVLYSLLGVDTSYYGAYTPSLNNPILDWSNVFSAAPGQGTAYPGYRRANQWHLQDPRVIQWNAAFEQNIGGNVVFKASYIGSHTYDLINSPDLNQVAPNTTGLASGTAALNSLTPAQRAQILKFPNFNEVLTRANGPSDKYNAMIVELNRRFSQGLSFTNAYTWTSNSTNALGSAPSSAIPTGGQGDNGGNVQNAFDIHSDYGPAYYDYRNKFLSTAVYDLPVGRGRKYLANINRLEDLVVGGWSTTGIFLFHTGNFLTPYFPSGVSDPSGTNPSERSVKQQRPDCNEGASGYQHNPTIASFFNAAAYTIPANNIGRFGNCSVGILQGPKTTTLSMSAGKNFALTERFILRYEAQFSNLFNITNWGTPNMNVSSSQFGLITSSQSNLQGSQAGPRTIQMSLRVAF